MTWPRSAMNLVGRGGFDAFQSVRPRYEDPYPLDEAHFLCARELGEGDWSGPGQRPEMGLYLVDVSGNEVLLHAEPPACFNPLPLAARVVPVLPTAGSSTGGRPRSTSSTPPRART